MLKIHILCTPYVTSCQSTVLWCALQGCPDDALYKKNDWYKKCKWKCHPSYDSNVDFRAIMTTYTTEERGSKNSVEYRLFFKVRSLRICIFTQVLFSIHIHFIICFGQITLSSQPPMKGWWGKSHLCHARHSYALQRGSLQHGRRGEKQLQSL